MAEICDLKSANLATTPANSSFNSTTYVAIGTTPEPLQEIASPSSESCGTCYIMPEVFKFAYKIIMALKSTAISQKCRDLLREFPKIAGLACSSVRPRGVRRVVDDTDHTKPRGGSVREWVRLRRNASVGTDAFSSLPEGARIHAREGRRSGLRSSPAPVYPGCALSRVLP